MGSFKLGKMTLKSLFTKPSTVLYPFEEKPQPAGIKGHIENDIASCTLCGTCSRVCPSGALIVDRKAGTWSIDRFRCVQCGSCVLNCPVPCLTMVPGYQKPARQISRDTLEKPAPLSRRARCQGSGEKG